ncbi:MAG: FtsX-like permease family protein [Candidatus Zixiibacteriota bacterium]
MPDKKKKSRFELWIARRYLFSKRPRSGFVKLVTFFSIGSIFLGVMALIVSLSMMNGLKDVIRGRMISTNAHITMYSFEKDGLSKTKEVMKRVEESHKDIEAVAPFVYNQTVISSRDKTYGIVVRGIMPSYEKKASDVIDKVTSGMFFSDRWEKGYYKQTDFRKRESIEKDASKYPQDMDPSRKVLELEKNPPDILPPITLGTGLASNLQVLPGDTIIMYTLAGKKGAFGGMRPKPKRFQVSAIFETGLYDYDATLAYIPMDVAQDFFDMGTNISGLQIKIDNFYDADKVAAVLEERIGFPYYFKSWAQMNKNLYSWMTLEKWGLTLVLSLIIAVAAFNIASTLIMVVLERTTEIGVLRALGIGQKRIRKIFILQGAYVGIIGTVLGTVVGIALCIIQQNYGVISLPAELYTISQLPMKVQFWDVFFIVIASFGISMVSAIYPASYAARLKPIDAIRYG